MKRTVRLIGIASSTVIFSSAVLAFSAEQMGIPMKDSTKEKAGITATATPKLKPQTTCPIQGDIINKNLFVDYNGKRIYVCCEGCLADVKKDPEGAIKKLELMGQSVETISTVNTSEPVQQDTASKPDTSTNDKNMSGSEMKDMDTSNVMKNIDTSNVNH